MKIYHYCPLKKVDSNDMHYLMMVVFRGVEPISQVMSNINDLQHVSLMSCMIHAIQILFMVLICIQDLNWILIP